VQDQINESLGRKLAGLDLSEAEAEALVVALGGQVDAEVSGFRHAPGNMGINIGVGELQECTISKSLAGELGRADWFVADSFSFGVEREMKE